MVQVKKMSAKCAEYLKYVASNKKWSTHSLRLKDEKIWKEMVIVAAFNPSFHPFNGKFWNWMGEDIRFLSSEETINALVYISDYHLNRAMDWGHVYSEYEKTRMNLSRKYTTETLMYMYGQSWSYMEHDTVSKILNDVLRKLEIEDKAILLCNKLKEAVIHDERLHTWVSRNNFFNDSRHGIDALAEAAEILKTPPKLERQVAGHVDIFYMFAKACAEKNYDYADVMEKYLIHAREEELSDVRTNLDDQFKVYADDSFIERDTIRGLKRKKDIDNVTIRRSERIENKKKKGSK